MDLLVEPVKDMLEKACEAAGGMISEFKNEVVKVELSEFIDDEVVALYLKVNGEVVFKRVWKLELNNDVLEARTMLYGSFLTEAIATYCITAMKVKEIESGGKGLLEQLPKQFTYKTLKKETLDQFIDDMKKSL